MTKPEWARKTGTDYYRLRGYIKSINLHVTMELYEKLRKRAFRDRTSLQVAARKALERGL